MSFVENISSVEAVLFAYGETVPVKVLTEATGIDAESLDHIITLLNDRYDESHSALQVLRLGDAYQLATRMEYAPVIKKVFDTGKNAALSTAAMETLAVIAYNQPVTKSFVDTVRGVDSAAVIARLTEKDLVEEAERLDVPGRPIAYRTTRNFLRCFGLSSVEDLPQLSEVNKKYPLLSEQQERSEE